MKKQSTLGMIKATNANAVVLGLSKLKRTLSLLTLALFTGALSSQADIILIVDDNDVADEVTSFNITTGTETSAGLTALEDTQASESWGGGILKDSGGPAITFTTTQIISYSGTVYTAATGADFHMDTNGMGIESSAGGDERNWLVDGQESWTWTADQDLEFKGTLLRNFGGTSRGFTISSINWVNLVGVVPEESGIVFTPGTGTFSLLSSGADEDVTLQNLVGATGPDLFLQAGTGITFANTGATGTAFDAFTFRAAIPEPSSLSLLLLGLAGMIQVRRRIKNKKPAAP